MGRSSQEVIVKQTITLDLAITATGKLAPVDLDLLGARGQIVGVKVRQPVGGVVTTASLWIADGNGLNLASVTPPDEVVGYKRLAFACTPSATVAASSEFPQATGSGWYYSSTESMQLSVEVTAVSAATASVLIVDVISRIQQ
jgi:hypothetical protein